MKFIPFDNKIEIQPIENDSAFVNEDTSLIEAGTVVSIGKDVTFVKVGDIITFDSWGCQKTPQDAEGKFHYVIPEDKNVVIGKYGSDE